MFYLKILRAVDKDVVIEKLGKDPKIDDKPFRKSLPKMLTGDELLQVCQIAEIKRKLTGKKL